MIYIVLNAPAILLAALAGQFAGLIIRRGSGVGLPGAATLAVAFVAQAWFAAILAGALILAPPRADPWVMALASAVVIWIGFVVPATIVTLRQRAVRWRGVGFDCAQWLAVMLMQAAVLKAVGLVPPPG